MTSTASTVEPPAAGAPPPTRERRWRSHLVAALFLAPAGLLVGIWIVYPTVWTFVRSFFDRSGDEFVAFDNYETLFTDDTLLTAVKNNALWVLVVPSLVTAIGLVFAVLTERVRLAVAFKVAVFMPMAISLFAAGVIWRLMYEKDPTQGTLNAGVAVVKDAVDPPGVLSAARPSSDALQGTPRGGLVLADEQRAGSVAQLGLTGISSSDVPDGAVQAVVPEALAGGITGVVWRDFRPGGGTAGELEDGEVGLPGVTVELRDPSGGVVAQTTTADDGTFVFEDVGAGSFRAAIGSETFREPYAGVSWLGAGLIVPAVMIAYTWVWAGFAMVVIAAGLAAIPRDLLEAARTDGASEWQVFRRVTVPLLAPVLTVVFVTMIINVLKVFDIVISV
ncbi:MAG: ABC transporter permease subunit, partial [Thermoleophilia bacterium]|nr:ABC transporter permease subunit [Thermoleophilia bacterium]